MSSEIAILSALVKRTDGRASRIEIWDEVKVFDLEAIDDRSFDLACSELLELGLLVLVGDEISITDAGRSVFRAIEHPNETEISSSANNPRETLTTIDRWIGTDARLKIFGLGLRDENDLKPEASISTEMRETSTFEAPGTTASDPSSANAMEGDGTESDAMESLSPPDTVGNRREGSIDAVDQPTSPTADLPSFLKETFGSKSKVSSGTKWRGSTSRKTERFNSIRSTVGRFAAIWRGHLAQAPSSFTKADRADVARGIMVVALSLLTIFVCVGGLLALNQIQSLKTQIKRMQQTLAPIKTEVARLDNAQNGRTGEHEDARSPPPRKSVAAVENLPPSSKLELSQDEIRLIKQYIKPAPATGQTAHPINLGDPVTIATIPLPSPVTEKIPKLLGARFTIQNGAIVLLKRGSHQADAVLATN